MPKTIKVIVKREQFINAFSGSIRMKDMAGQEWYSLPPEITLDLPVEQVEMPGKFQNKFTSPLAELIRSKIEKTM